MTLKNESSSLRRSLLFVPAIRPDRFAKALATAADAVCIDLEDGVGDAFKSEARLNALDLLSASVATKAEVSIRINDAKSDLGQQDLQMLVESGHRPDAVMLPKVAGVDEIEQVDASLKRLGAPAVSLIVQIETIQGLMSVNDIASASPGITAIFFGAIDLASELGCAVEWESLLYARSQVLLAAAQAGVIAIDSPFLNVQAPEALAEESAKVRRLGYVGKAAIHPLQVPIINEQFSPSLQEIGWAKKIISAYDKNQGGVLLVEGQLIERPVIRSAQRILKAASLLDE
tara:strand:- start:7178 stop:8041 length:864 start_codon:yes stop_codon:yes gene_type:complete